MGLSNSFEPAKDEIRLQAFWQAEGIYHFDPQAAGPVYSIDTPPATVSGQLHLGHVYSYSQTDFMARFWRMRGRNLFYPMGYDDNGLPTERLVERKHGIRAQDVSRKTFIEKCLEVSQQAEQEYQALWQRLGLSIDWRYSYRTIDDLSRRTSQWSFIDLYRKGLVYRQEAPAIWCPECQTAIAQAELSDLERETEFLTLSFQLENGESLPIATTRPELLPACAALFVHPDDPRHRDWVGRRARVPLIGRDVPILADPRADPEKGTGAVMCCTFGDTIDVEWWYTHHLPLFAVIGKDGRLTAEAGEYAGLTTRQARHAIIKTLEEQGFLVERQPLHQSGRVHERCDTPVEYIVTHQWFVRVLDFKVQLLAAAEQIQWHPEHMKVRYQEWVENLHWDWCISRQRYFGVPFPLWYCRKCGELRIADESQLPVDPLVDRPLSACACGSDEFLPEEDVFDTWATSSLSPQIVGKLFSEPSLYQQVYPFSLRPQAHEIIRTWAFYTIVKSLHHFNSVPWKEAAISGWGLAPQGTGKISKSRGGGPLAPMELIERYSADAVRYWSASTGFGKDAVINEEKVQTGARLVTKIWNVARFCERFLQDFSPPGVPPALSPADRWILSRTQGLTHRVTDLFEEYEYAAAKSELETFFWTELADNYLEMVKQRLYNVDHPEREGARFVLDQTLLTLVKLFAPLIPHITEQVYQGLFAGREGCASIHRSAWPEAHLEWHDLEAESAGTLLVGIAGVARRYKSENNLSVGAPIRLIQLSTLRADLKEMLSAAASDLMSITRANQIVVHSQPASGLSDFRQQIGEVEVVLYNRETSTAYQSLIE